MFRKNKNLIKKSKLKKESLFTLVFCFLSKKMLKICFLHYENNASLQHSFDGSIKITAQCTVLQKLQSMTKQQHCTLHNTNQCQQKQASNNSEGVALSFSLYSHFYTHFLLLIMRSTAVAWVSVCYIFLTSLFYLFYALPYLDIWLLCCFFFASPPLLDSSETHKSPRCPERKAQISCAKNQNVFYVIYTLAQRG